MARPCGEETLSAGLGPLDVGRAFPGSSEVHASIAATGAEEVSDVQGNDLEFRLSGMPTPDGEISLADLTAIAAPLQELATRVGRYVAEQSGPGRSLAAVEKVTRLRLTGLAAGSTRLLVGYGQTDVLPIDDGLEQRIADDFWEVVSGLGSETKPYWTTRRIDESALRLLDGLSRAREVRISRGHHTDVTFRPETVDRTVWMTSEQLLLQEATMVGRLEALDLSSGRFRLRDDVGNTIPLVHVRDPHAAAAFVDRRVAATGREIRGLRGEFKGLESPTVELFVVPSTGSGASIDWQEILSRPGPDPDGGADLTDEEFAALLAAMKGN